MERLIEEFYKNNNDVTDMNIKERSIKTPEEAFIAHNKLLLLENPIFLSTGNKDEQSLKQRLEIPQNFFLHGNIALNDSSNNNYGGNIITTKINLSPLKINNKLNKSRYNIFGIEKRIFKISINTQISESLDIKAAYDISNVYIFKCNPGITLTNTLDKIGEVVDISDNISPFWIELYDSSTFFNTSDSSNILFSTNETCETSIAANKKYKTTITDKTDASFTDIPIFKEITLTSYWDDIKKKMFLDISGGYLNADISSNKITIEKTTINNLTLSSLTNSKIFLSNGIFENIKGISSEDVKINKYGKLTVKDLYFKDEYTFIDVSNLEIDDNIINLNSAVSDINTSDCGILIERPGSPTENVFMGWHESTDTFIFGKTTSNGLAIGELPPIAIGIIQADISGIINTVKQEKITEIPNLSKIGNLIDGSLNNGFDTIDISSNISTTTQISAPTIEATGTDETHGLSGELITTTQNYITTLPKLTGVGSLTDGSLNVGFGPINLINSTIAALTIEAKQGLSGEIITTTQNYITELPNLTWVGDLSGGSLNNGFGPINLRNSTIAALTIEAKQGLSGEIITTTQNYITKLPNLTWVGNLIDGSLNEGFGPINLGLTMDNNSYIKAKTIRAEIIDIKNPDNSNNNFILHDDYTNLINDISGTNIKLDTDASFTMIDSNHPTDRTKDRGIRVSNGELQYQNENKTNWDNFTYNVSTSEVKNVIITLMGPSRPSNISVMGATVAPDIQLDISWNKPTYNNYLNNEVTGEDSEVGYKIELSINSNFIPIYLSHIVEKKLDGNISIILIDTTPPLRCTGYYVRISAKNEKGRYGRPEIFEDSSGNPKMVSAGDNCYDYETKEKWIALPDYYKKQIETIMFFKKLIIPKNALNQDVSKNNLPDPSDNNFTIEISGNITDIAENAFSGLSTLKQVKIKNSDKLLTIGEKAFYDCVDLSAVDIGRNLVDKEWSSGWDTSTNWFGVKYDGSGSQISLNFNENIENNVSKEKISNIIQNRTTATNKATLKIKSTHPLIKYLTTISSPYTMSYYDISFNITWDPMKPLRQITSWDLDISTNSTDIRIDISNIEYDNTNELDITKYKLVYEYNDNAKGTLKILEKDANNVYSFYVNYNEIRKGEHDVSFSLYPINRDGEGDKESTIEKRNIPQTKPQPPTIPFFNLTTIGNQESKFVLSINVPNDIGKWYVNNDDKRKNIKYHLTYEISGNTYPVNSPIKIEPNAVQHVFDSNNNGQTIFQQGGKSIKFNIYSEKDGLKSNNNSYIGHSLPPTKPNPVPNIYDVSFVNNTFGNMSIKVNWDEPEYNGGATTSLQYKVMIKNSSSQYLMNEWIAINRTEPVTLLDSYWSNKKLYELKGQPVYIYIRAEHNGMYSDAWKVEQVPTTAPGKLRPISIPGAVILGDDKYDPIQNRIRLKWYTLKDTGGIGITKYKIKWYVDGLSDVSGEKEILSNEVTGITTGENEYELYTLDNVNLKRRSYNIVFDIFAYNDNGWGPGESGGWRWYVYNNYTRVNIKNIRLLPRWPVGSGVKDNDETYQPTDDTKSYIDISWNVYDFGDGLNLTDIWNTNINFKITLQYHRWRWTDNNYAISWKDITTINLPFNQNSNTGRSYIGLEDGDKKGWEFGYSWQVPDRFKGYIIRVQIIGIKSMDSTLYISDTSSNITYDSVTNGIGPDFKQGDNIWTDIEHQVLMDITHWAKLSPTLRGDNWSHTAKGGRCMAPETGPNITMVDRNSPYPLNQFTNAIVYDILTVNDGHRVNDYWKTGTYTNKFRTTGNFDYTDGKLLILSKYDIPINFSENPDGYSDTTRNYIGSFSAPNVDNGYNIEQSIFRELWVEVYNPLTNKWESPRLYDSTTMSPSAGTDNLGYELCTSPPEGRARLWIKFKVDLFRGWTTLSKKIDLTFPLQNPDKPLNPIVVTKPVNDWDRLKITWEPPAATSDYRKYDFTLFVQDDYRYRVKFFMTNGGSSTLNPSSDSGTVWDNWLYSANLIKEAHITTILPVRSSTVDGAGGWGDENWPVYNISDPNSYYESEPAILNLASPNITTFEVITNANDYTATKLIVKFDAKVIFSWVVNKKGVAVPTIDNFPPASGPWEKDIEYIFEYSFEAWTDYTAYGMAKLFADGQVWSEIHSYDFTTGKDPNYSGPDFKEQSSGNYTVPERTIQVHSGYWNGPAYVPPSTTTFGFLKYIRDITGSTLNIEGNATGWAGIKPSYLLKYSNDGIDFHTDKWVIPAAKLNAVGQEFTDSALQTLFEADNDIYFSTIGLFGTQTGVSAGHHSSSSIIKFEIMVPGNYRVTWWQSSEQNYDYIKVYKAVTEGSWTAVGNGYGIAGHSSTPLDYLKRGDLVKIEYVKDGSVDNGLDKLEFILHKL